MSNNKLSKSKLKRSNDIPLRKLDNTRDAYCTKVANEFLKPSYENKSLDNIYKI
jgi:hypothetical protein